MLAGAFYTKCTPPPKKKNQKKQKKNKDKRRWMACQIYGCRQIAHNKVVWRCGSQWHHHIPKGLFQLIYLTSSFCSFFYLTNQQMIGWLVFTASQPICVYYMLRRLVNRILVVFLIFFFLHTVISNTNDFSTAHLEDQILHYY